MKNLNMKNLDNKKLDTKKITYLGVLLCLAVIINLIESLIPSIIVPGARLGFSNIIIMVILYKYEFKDSVIVLILRILLVGIFRGTLLNYPFYMSLFGGLSSIIVMKTLKSLKIFTEIGVSVCGAVMHTIAQICVAIVMFETKEIASFLPYLLIVSLVTGVIVGMVCKKINTLSVFDDIK